jgi:hypothetical protein
MDRRELLGVLGAGAAGLVAMSETSLGQGQAKERLRYHSLLNQVHVDCLEACTACADVCNEASLHCIQQLEKGDGEKPYHSRTHRLTTDCAAICSTAAALVAR